MLDHNIAYEAENAIDPNDPEPQTGDNSHLYFWSLLGGASLTIFGRMEAERRRRRRLCLTK
jgi:hypothetical protein